MLEVETLIKEKTHPCVSIIIPTQRTERKKNYEVLKKAVQHAKSLLVNKPLPEEIKTAFAQKIDEAVKVLPSDILDGLGIFISPTQSRIIPFPFPVEQKIIVDNNFETRDLIYLRQYTTLYYVLSVSNRAMRLYQANMATLKEIKDENFPLAVGDDYEYAPPSVGTSYGNNSLKSFEKDKTTISAIRVKAMLRDADAHLMSYMSKDDTRLIIAGTQKVIPLFLGLTRFLKHIIGKVSGSFTEKNVAILGKSAWLTLVRNKKSEDEQYVQELIEKSNKNLAEGVRAAWKTAQEGRGLLLVVEKDFHCKAYQQPNRNGLHLQPPKKPYTILPDAVNDLIETVNKKNGKILFVERDFLKKLGHVMLLLRY